MKTRSVEKARKTTHHAKYVPWNDMNRKQRREMMRKIQSADLSLQVVHPDAAGIDIGNESHYVAVPPDRDSQPVRRFGCTTAELKAMADWLNQCCGGHVQTAAHAVEKLEYGLRLRLENGFDHQLAGGIANRHRDRCLMHIEPNILGVIHEGAPCCR